MLQQQGGFFSYKFVAGELLSSKLCYSTCFAALQWAQSNLWRNIEPPDKFSEVLDQFYIQKTFRRLDKFIATFESAPETEVVINQISCQPVAFLLEAIKPELINGGLASSFHGDFHSDNILITQQGFQLIDWRENFGNSFNVGDRYYDLGKFLHTLELSVESMDNHEFQIFRLSNREIKLEHSCDFSQIDGLEAFWDFVSLHGYSEKRIRFVNALIYINMSPLYEGDLARYLYYFGRYQLQKTYRQN
ncbi:MAG: phosphotransferase [SAR324 cluster bacterium]|nr:phosphotransferase [SAR324 cluster bacterium]